MDAPSDAAAEDDLEEEGEGKGGGGGERKVRVGRLDAIAATEKVGRVLGFVWTGLVLPLLRAHFYVTETEGTRNRVVYYRKFDWHLITTAVPYYLVPLSLFTTTTTPAATATDYFTTSRYSQHY